MINSSRVKIIIVVLFITALAISLFLRWMTSYSGWGKGNLSVAEASYYSSRMDRIIKNWIQTRSNANHKIDGYFVDSYRVCLVIDLQKQAMWLEDNGQVQQDNYMEFPGGMKWTFYHITPNETTELENRVILKYRGFGSSRQTPEAFYLVGTGRGRGHISCHIYDLNGGAGYDQNKFSLPKINFRTSTEKDLFGSLIVLDEEYQQYRDSIPYFAESQAETGNIESERLSKLAENEVTWNRIEKHLYQEIEKQVQREGFELRRISIKPGQDFSAAKCEITGQNNNIVKKIFGGLSSIENFMKIDNLGNDIWYVKSGPDPTFPARPIREKQYDFEFLVSADGKIDESRRNELIQKGRRMQQPEPIPESKWKVTLANSMKIEFLGICENPSAGKQWWAPDGSPLDYVPYINALNYGRSREDRRIYEFAWRTTPNPRGSGMSIEGSNGSYYHAFYDRYGNRLSDNMHAEGFGFDKSKISTTLKFTFKTNNNNEQTVLFKNISLVPGENQGFEIEAQEAEEK